MGKIGGEDLDYALLDGSPQKTQPHSIQYPCLSYAHNGNAQVK